MFHEALLPSFVVHLNIADHVIRIYSSLPDAIRTITYWCAVRFVGC